MYREKNTQEFLVNNNVKVRYVPNTDYEENSFGRNVIEVLVEHVNHNENSSKWECLTFDLAHISILIKMLADCHKSVIEEFLIKKEIDEMTSSEKDNS